MEDITGYLKDRTDQELIGMVTTLIDQSSKFETKKFVKWRSFRIGGISKEALLQKIETGSSSTKWAKDMIRQPGFAIQEIEEEVETIMLSPDDFGFKQMPTTEELFNPVHLSEWSKKNATKLPAGYTVELLPVEAGPHIRDQYKDQLKGEVLWVATKSITDSRGSDSVFSVYWGVFGVQWLSGIFVRPDEQWSPNSCIVFRLRKIT